MCFMQFKRTIYYFLKRYRRVLVVFDKFKNHKNLS